MYKIAILGCENSHADIFLDFIIKEKQYPDIEVVGVHSEDEEAMKTLNEKYGVYTAKTYDEFVGKIDGVIITARHGDNHYKYAKPYIDSKIPMFIDKPITVSEEDAKEFKAELVKNNIKVTGGSMCIYADPVQELKQAVIDKTYGEVLGGFLRSPVNMTNEYGNFFFYSQHLVQVMCEIFGYHPKSVYATKNDKGITAIVRYENFDVSIEYTEMKFRYYAAISCENEMIFKEYNIVGAAKKEFDAYYNILKGGEQNLSYDDFFASVYILNAINRSCESNKEETINY